MRTHPERNAELGVREADILLPEKKKNTDKGFDPTYVLQDALQETDVRDLSWRQTQLKTRRSSQIPPSLWKSRRGKNKNGLFRKVLQTLRVERF